MVTTAQARFDGWAALGHTLPFDGTELFVVDLEATGTPTGPPVFVLHGFPSCTYDWVGVLPRLRERRRVVLFDLPGFGLSGKPDRRYGMRWWADAAEAVLAEAGLDEVALVTHDVGDSVGGEVLARTIDGTLDLTVTERVLTNGSIYVDLTQFTDGQQFLLSLPDERLSEPLGGDRSRELFQSALVGTYSPAHEPDRDELEAQWLFARREAGLELLPRTIRYIEDRKADEGRFTGAIEAHPSPLGIVWGVDDPIAVPAMVDRLAARRPDARVIRLAGAGHYPMVEEPARFTDALLELLA